MENNSPQLTEEEALTKIMHINASPEFLANPANLKWLSKVVRIAYYIDLPKPKTKK
jgi:hypothetical protein